jgi:hypothetical protein
MRLTSLFSLVLLGACSSDTPATPLPGGGDSDAGTSDAGADAKGPAGPSGLPCDVERVLKNNCQQCHAASPIAGAPFPLVSHADLLAPLGGGLRAVDRALARMALDADPMPPSPNARVSASDQAVLSAWVTAGAPRSSETCTNGDPDSGVKPIACEVDIKLRPQTAHALPVGTVDQYVCFGFDVTPSQKRHITAIAPQVDNARVVHHLVLVEAASAQPRDPFVCPSSMASFGRMVYAWAPGGAPLELPPEAGFPVEGTKHYLVQVHYNNAGGIAGQSDSSGIDLCTTPTLRPNDADVVAFGSTRFTIPVNPPNGRYAKTCQLPIQQGYADMHFFIAMPHMHELGLDMKTTLKRGAQTIDLGTVANWQFGNQFWLPISAVTQIGDTIETTCGWKNDTGTAVKYGEKTSDEMCYSFSMYYPRKASIPSWGLPAQACN